MERRRLTGIRARQAIVLLAAAAIAVALMAAAFWPLVLPGLSRQRGERLLWTARVAAGGAPADPERWSEWSGRLAGLLPETRVFLVRLQPGQPGFLAECASHDLSPDDVISAYVEGERLAALHPPELGDVVGEELSPGQLTWGSLIPIQGSFGQRAVLGVFESGEAPRISETVWGLWLLLSGLVLVVVVAVGYLTAWVLVVRPLARVIATTRRAADDPGVRESSDDRLETVTQAVSALAKRAKEAGTRAERQSSELRRIRADLGGAQATLLRAEKLASVGQLAAGIAHEIGNPMGIILGMSEILKGGGTGEEDVRKYSADIHGAALRAHGILKDLLTFARPSRDEAAVADVGGVLAETLQLLAPQKRFRDISVVTDPPTGAVGAEIRPSQLQQILLNLLINAADAMGGRGRIDVRVRTDDRSVLVDVADEGPGIAAEEFDRIFDPFYTTKPPGEGTGLGLAISAQIAGVYGGDLSVESPPGHGACFTLRLWRV